MRKTFCDGCEKEIPIDAPTFKSEQVLGGQTVTVRVKAIKPPAKDSWGMRSSFFGGNEMDICIDCTRRLIDGLHRESGI
jgi:hypothetical protein